MTEVYRGRRGRMTAAQKRAYEVHSDPFVLDTEHFEPASAFGRDAPLGLEVGFGMGHALLDWAVAAPHMNLLGVEIYRPGVGALLLGIERLALENVRISECPAQDVVGQHLSPGAVDEVRVLFPDPWPKNRHSKRRLFQPNFVAALANVLRPGGSLKVATDWRPYAEEILTLLQAVPDFDNPNGGGFAPPDPERPETRFEQRGRRLGHEIFELEYLKKTGDQGVQ